MPLHDISLIKPDAKATQVSNSKTFPIGTLYTSQCSMVACNTVVRATIKVNGKPRFWAPIAPNFCKGSQFVVLSLCVLAKLFLLFWMCDLVALTV